MTISKRHHYLPAFFIKGFIGEDGKIALYNKKKGVLEKNRKSPKQVFFEWNRNTFEVHGKRTDFVEQLYKFGEDRFVPTYKKLISGKKEYTPDPYDLLHIMLFILVTHWRIPINDDKAREFLDKLSPNNPFFEIKNRSTGEKAPLELFNQIISEPSFQEGSKIIRAIGEFLNTDRIQNVDDWKLSFVPEGSPKLHLLSDNPLLLEDESNEDILKSILIFPLSKGISIHNTNGKSINEIPPENVIYADILSFLQADTYVCGPNSDYIQTVAKLASLYSSPASKKSLRQKVFDIYL